MSEIDGVAVIKDLARQNLPLKVLVLNLHHPGPRSLLPPAEKQSPKGDFALFVAVTLVAGFLGGIALLEQVIGPMPSGLQI